MRSIHGEFAIRAAETSPNHCTFQGRGKMSEDNVLETVLEHHTDMLMVEELRCDADFSRWFATRCGIPHGPVTFVRNSVWDATRESDVLVHFGDASGHAVLIENKVTAPLSLNQADDYHRRGAALVAQNRCAGYKTCILAPATWISVYSEHGFDCGLTYEEVAEAVDRGNSSRSQWRAEVFRQGARRAKRKLTFTKEETALFLRDYYAFADAHYPELGTKRSTGFKGTIVVFPLALGKGSGRYLDVQHNIQEARMKIAVYAASKAAVEAALGDRAAEHGWAFVENGQRVDLSASVPAISVDAPVTAQEHEMQQALEVAKSMVGFVRRNADIFQSIPINAHPKKGSAATLNHRGD